MGNHVGKTQRIGGHTVVVQKQIAEGGFAFVYLVKDTHNGRNYALKRILVHDREEMTLVQNEINVMKQLSGDHPHPHIVRYIDSSVIEVKGNGSVTHEIYILMEYCGGGHVVDLMNSRLSNRFSESEVVNMFYDICDGVCHMHSQDPPIAHRDLKVENVLIDSEAGKLKLCDFGSSTTRIIPAYGRSKIVIGEAEEEIQKFTTMPYRPPEMVDLYRNKEVSEKVDVWALGCILYKLMYFATPFEESGPLQILNVNYTIPPSPQYPPHLLDLVKYLLNPDPDLRPDIWDVMERVCELKRIPPPPRRRPRRTLAAAPAPLSSSISFTPPSVPAQLPPLNTSVSSPTVSYTPNPPTTPAPATVMGPPAPVIRRLPLNQSISAPVSPILPPAPASARRHRPTNTSAGVNPNLVTESLHASAAILAQASTNVNIPSPGSGRDTSDFYINHSTSPDRGLDTTAMQWLVVNTWEAQGAARVLGLVTMRPLTDPMVCIKMLVLVHKLILEGHPNVVRDLQPRALLFQNLHVGWIKQIERGVSPEVANVLASYSLLLYKKTIFHSLHPLLEGNLSFDLYFEREGTVPAQALPIATERSPITHMSVLQLLDILKDIISFSPYLSSSSQVVPTEILEACALNVIKEAHNAFHVIAYSLSNLLQADRMGADLTTTTTTLTDLVSRYQTMFPLLCEFYATMTSAHPRVQAPPLPGVLPNVNVFPPQVIPPSSLRTVNSSANDLFSDPSNPFASDASDPFYAAAGSSSSSEADATASSSPHMRATASPFSSKFSSPQASPFSSPPLSPTSHMHRNGSQPDLSDVPALTSSFGRMAGILSPRAAPRGVSLTNSQNSSTFYTSPLGLSQSQASIPIPTIIATGPESAPAPQVIPPIAIAPVASRSRAMSHRRAVSNTTEMLRRQQNQLDQAQELLQQQMEHRKRMQRTKESELLAIPEDTARPLQPSSSTSLLGQRAWYE
eukprot:TRINITY_DN1955_c0_g1_i2.p1 TRINITY_DN1955_c0_g1~~TRINITY_DN1955_c0_g1_i2.p1  ORF type:complete len:964 (+),score=205.72 TRINITY_DN1955_c0_g1_i2:94-2985(+)